MRIKPLLLTTGAILVLLSAATGARAADALLPAAATAFLPAAPVAALSRTRIAPVVSRSGLILMSVFLYPTLGRS